jgi:hypothetical protein
MSNVGWIYICRYDEFALGVGCKGSTICIYHYSGILGNIFRVIKPRLNTTLTILVFVTFTDPFLYKPTLSPVESVT